MISKRGRFLIRHKKRDIQYINDFDWLNLEKEYQKIKKFFDYQEGIKDIRIHFIYSDKDFLFLTGRNKHENWMCAMTGYHNTINIFSPSVIESFTNHSKNSIFRTLTHEISHLFYGYSKFPRFSLWDEGIAEYLSRGECNNKINFELPTLKGSNNQEYNYGVGHLLISSIIKQFPKCGDQKIREFLGRCSDDNEKYLLNLFIDVFGINVNTLINQKGGTK